MLDNSQKTDIEYRLKVSYLEIYNESIDDLFDVTNKNLKVHESPQRGLYVAGLTEEYPLSVEDVYALLEMGQNNRVVSCTQMNAVSSRSHRYCLLFLNLTMIIINGISFISVFILKLEQTSPETGTKSGKLNLVDLAGSEKVGKTGATGQTLKEAQGINKSLSALGGCINALVEKKKHIPFRDSKLTRILQVLYFNLRYSLHFLC